MKGDGKHKENRKDFSTLYPYDDEVKRSLLEFRRQPLTTLKIDGVEWEYLTTGDGRAVLFLHGMAGAYDIWWQQIDALKHDYRIVSVTYPAVDSLKKMGEAIIRILEKEGIEKVSLVGTSLGGYLAQYLVAKYPERVEKAVFANTFPPNDLFEKQNRILTWAMPFFPEWLIMYSFRRNLAKKVIPASQNSEIVKAYLLEQSFGKISKEQFIARYRCVIDKFKPTSHDIPLMLIESDNDPLIPLELREELKRLYPFQKVYTFHGKGHFPYLNEPGIYTRLLGDFLG